MTHLADGTLRRSIDDAPDAATAAHLAGCSSCSARRDALAQTASVAQTALGPAPDAASLSTGAAHAVVRARILGEAAPPRKPFARRGVSWLLVPLAACAVVALFVATPLRSVAESFLAIFEPQQFAALPVTSADMAQLHALPDLSAFGTVRAGAREQDIRVDTVREAEQTARMPVRLPSMLGPDALDAPHFTVIAAHAAEFTFSAAKARMAARGRRLPPMPAWIDGSTLFAAVGPFVVATYPDPSGRYGKVYHRRGHSAAFHSGGFPALLVVQGPAPKISSTRATVRDIEKYLLAQPGMPPRLAAEIAAIGDPATTLPIPIPIDRSYATPVMVEGVRGLGIGDNTGVGAGVVWQRGGEIFAVAGTTTMQNVIAVADSLR